MGLWVRMAVSYMLVTFGAVLLVETVLIGIYAPRLVSDKVNEQNLLTDARTNAGALAMKLSSRATATDGLGFPAGVRTTTSGASPTPSPTSSPDFLPSRSGNCLDAAKSPVLDLLLDIDGSVLSSSFPDCYSPHHPAPPLPGAGAGPAGASGVGQTAGGDRVAWARAPVVQAPRHTFESDTVSGAAGLVEIPGAHQVATLYEQRQVTADAGGVRLGNVRPMLLPGLVVLASAVPVGLLFGFVSMRRPVHRLRRLAATTQALASGDLDQRVQVSGRDELSHLEADVNRMAERLSTALAKERALAETRARTNERARIARDLHDSVSQGLFSLRLLAGGAARALPADAPLHHQLRQLEETAATTTHEMQAMLLQLRPAALADAVLAEALEHVAQTYRQRVGVQVHTDLVPVILTPQRADALLRIAQEALANAVRHGHPSQLTLTLTDSLLRIADNGRGFDAGAPTLGMGLTLMRERATEVGAALTLTSAPGAGTTIEVRLP